MLASQKFIVNPLVSSFYVCPFQTQAERREEKHLNLYNVNISHLLVAPPYDPRGSHQSDFELNIEKGMTEILLITINSIIVHSP